MRKTRILALTILLFGWLLLRAPIPGGTRDQLRTLYDHGFRMGVAFHGPHWLRWFIRDDLLIRSIHTGLDQNCFGADEQLKRQSFEYWRDPAVRDKLIQIMINLPNLDTFDIRGRDIDDEWLDVAPQLPELKILTLYDRTISTEAVERISRCKQLEILNFEKCKLEADVSFVSLKNLHRLSGVFFSLTQVSDSQVAEIAQLSQLEQLQLDWPSISSPNVLALTRLPRLSWLSIYLPEDDESPGILAQMKSLKELEVGSRVTDAGALGLVNAKHLQVLHLRDACLKPETHQTLRSSLPHLQSFYARCDPHDPFE